MSAPSEECRLMLVGEVDEPGGAESPFEGLGWRIKRVPDCMHFLSAVLRHRPHIVVCEWELPDGNWREVAGIVQTLHRPPAVIVVAKVTSWEARQEVLDRGGADLIPKPVDREQLKAAIELACLRRQGIETPGRK